MKAKEWAEEKERVEEMELVLRVDGERERAERVEACLQRIAALEEGVGRLRKALWEDFDGEQLCDVMDATAGLVEE